MGPSPSGTSAQRRARHRAKAKAHHERVRARPIRPGARYKVTRSCLEHRMFLAPDKAKDALHNLIGYLLGLYLGQYGLKLHAACFMSNHYHCDVTDTLGVLPEFKEAFNGVLARAVNALRGRFDRFWSADPPCDTLSPEEDGGLGDLVYTLINPVKAGLFKWGSRWPGFTTYGWKFGEVRRFYRPKWFFDANKGNLPDHVDLRLERPDTRPELSDEDFYAVLMGRVREREREIQKTMRAENRRFMGEAKVSRQHWNRPPKAPRDQFTTTPRVAASSKWLRLAQLQRDRRWEREYACARNQLAAGEDPLFPWGTYWMRRRAGVKVATAPPS